MTTTSVRERPIIFSCPMVRAILDGRKTQRRRVVKPQPVQRSFENWYPDRYNKSAEWCFWGKLDTPDHNKVGTFIGKCPYGMSGDQLWVRETFDLAYSLGNPRMKGMASFQFGNPDLLLAPGTPEEARVWACGWKRKRSIHMPRWASRITLEVTGVRVERVQDISEADARAEGVARGVCSHPDCTPGSCASGRYRPEFAMLWDSINAKRGYGWDANPWVWVIEFKLHEVKEVPE